MATEKPKLPLTRLQAEDWWVDAQLRRDRAAYVADVKQTDDFQLVADLEKLVSEGYGPNFVPGDSEFKISPML